MKLGGEEGLVPRFSGAVLRAAASTFEPRDGEAGQLHDPVGADDHLWRVHVAVNDACAVHGYERESYLTHDLDHDGGRELGSSFSGEQEGLASHELEDQVWPRHPFREQFAVIEDVLEAGLGDPGDGTCLPIESLVPAAIGCGLLAENPDCDVSE